MTRDRSKTYAEGIRQGAPEAIQVADRFHLLQNMAETLIAVLVNHASALEAVNEAHRPTSIVQEDD